MAGHRMQIARPSPQAAERYRLNPNHHVRVWCECMDDSAFGAGAFGTTANAATDVRRVGGWDWLGHADVREPGSALKLYREHVRSA